MEAVSQPRPDAPSDRTANTGGGTAADNLRVHAHLYKPRLKTSSAIPDFQSELRQYASKQGRNAAMEYATALGAGQWATPVEIYLYPIFQCCCLTCKCLCLSLLAELPLLLKSQHHGIHGLMTNVQWNCLGAARRAFLIKAETPGTSDVEAGLDQAAEEYISLLVGLINALPKPTKEAGGTDAAGKGDQVQELALEMEASSSGMSGLIFE